MGDRPYRQQLPPPNHPEPNRQRRNQLPSFNSVISKAAASSSYSDPLTLAPLKLESSGAWEDDLQVRSRVDSITQPHPENPSRQWRQQSNCEASTDVMLLSQRFTPTLPDPQSLLRRSSESSQGTVTTFDSEIISHASTRPLHSPPSFLTSVPPTRGRNHISGLGRHLTIRQQPIAARACGLGERDRRVIDPPPIVELEATSDVPGSLISDHDTTLVLHCTLLDKTGYEDLSELAEHSHHSLPTYRLIGTTVASAHHAKDDRNNPGVFFVFPDLSCRLPGEYRLSFTLVSITPASESTTGVPKANSVATTLSDVFAVYPAKEFPGMRESSALTNALRKQGVSVGVKRGPVDGKFRSRRFAEAGRGTASVTSSTQSDDEEPADGR